ncbi:MAG: hypothetical protein MZV49_14205, partial [Rhodopseudomonas palustris]|nr:hypothetical protein [Rhodopseudomonas palustris]
YFRSSYVLLRLNRRLQTESTATSARAFLALALVLCVATRRRRPGQACGDRRCGSPARPARPALPRRLGRVPDRPGDPGHRDEAQPAAHELHGSGHQDRHRRGGQPPARHPARQPGRVREASQAGSSGPGGRAREEDARAHQDPLRRSPPRQPGHVQGKDVRPAGPRQDAHDRRLGHPQGLARQAGPGGPQDHRGLPEDQPGPSP